MGSRKGDVSLYECSHARVWGSRILCYRGRSLGPGRPDYGIDAIRLRQGNRLALAACQGCPDFDEIGPPIPAAERGWRDIGSYVGGYDPCRRQTPTTHVGLVP